MGIPNLLSKLNPSTEVDSASGSHAKGGKQQGAISEAGEKLWAALSADLRSNPNHPNDPRNSDACWENALVTAQDLVYFLCGKNESGENDIQTDIPEDLRADIEGNFSMLQKTLRGLEIEPTKMHSDPHHQIAQRFLDFNIQIVDGLKKLNEQVKTRINQESHNKEVNN